MTPMAARLMAMAYPYSPARRCAPLAQRSAAQAAGSIENVFRRRAATGARHYKVVTPSVTICYWVGMQQCAAAAAAAARPVPDRLAGVSGERVGRAPLLEMRGICKRFFGVPVLADVALDCQAGEAHAIVGANRAGTSALMKV